MFHQGQLIHENERGEVQKIVNSPRANKERTIMLICYFKAYEYLSKIHSTTVFHPQLVLNLFLISNLF